MSGYVSLLDEWAASDRIAARFQARRPGEWQAWQTECRIWTDHSMNCDRCYLGKSCSEGDRLLECVRAAFALVEGR